MAKYTYLPTQRYNLFCSTGQAFWPFVFQSANIAGKLNFPSFLSLGLKEQYFNKFRKFLRSTCLHFHFDSLSQTFHRRNIHPSESVLQMCNNESYMLKTIIGCSLQNSKGLKYLNIQKAIQALKDFCFRKKPIHPQLIKRNGRMK